MRDELTGYLRGVTGEPQTALRSIVPDGVAVRGGDK